MMMMSSSDVVVVAEGDEDDNTTVGVVAGNNENVIEKNGTVNNNDNNNNDDHQNHHPVITGTQQQQQHDETFHNDGADTTTTTAMTDAQQQQQAIDFNDDTHNDYYDDNNNNKNDDDDDDQKVQGGDHMKDLLILLDQQFLTSNTTTTTKPSNNIDNNTTAAAANDIIIMINDNHTTTTTNTNTKAMFMEILYRIGRIIIHSTLYCMDILDHFFYYYWDTTNSKNDYNKNKKKKNSNNNTSATATATTITGAITGTRATTTTTIRVIPIVVILLLAILLSPQYNTTNHSFLGTLFVMIQSFVLYGIQQILHFLFTIIGTTIGIAFGLGLASHVCNVLDDYHYHYNNSKNQNHSNVSFATQQQQQQYDNNDGDDHRALYRRGSTTIPSIPSRRRLLSSSGMSTTSLGTSTSNMRNHHPSPNIGGVMTTSSTNTPITTTTTPTTNSLLLEDGQTYYSLMASAGYTIIYSNNNSNNNNNLLLSTSLRGQVIRNDQIPSSINYMFTNPIVPSTTTTSSSATSSDGTTSMSTQQQQQQQEAQYFYKSYLVFKDLFHIQQQQGQQGQQLVSSSSSAAAATAAIQHPSIQLALGTAMEYIIRDFVASWYSKMDIGCQYNYGSNDNNNNNNNNYNNNNDDNRQQASSSSSSSSAISDTKSTNHLQQQQQQPKSTFSRNMLYSVAIYRNIPFLDTIYYHVASIFGNLSIRVEQNVNVMELLLIKYTKILTGTFKWYRYIRKQIKTKLLLAQQSQQQQYGSTNSSILTTTTNIDGTNTDTDNNSTTTRTTTATPITRRMTVQQSLRRRASTAIRRTSQYNNNNNNNDTNLFSDSGGSGYMVLDDNNNNNNNTTTTTSPTKVSASTNIPISEIAITKEFLINNKLHKAITFGLDVPSLLYSDTNGRSCGIPLKQKSEQPEQSNESHITDAAGSSTTSTKSSVRLVDRDELHYGMTDDEVLAARLYNTNILAECELDYNRVLGHRMVKALISRSEFGSSIVQTILTEIMAGCVLTPIMSLFSPDTISSWIVMGLSPAKDTTSEATKSTTPSSSSSSSSSSTKPTKGRKSNNSNNKRNGIDPTDMESPEASIEVVMRGKETTEPDNDSVGIPSHQQVPKQDGITSHISSLESLPAIQEESSNKVESSSSTTAAAAPSETLVPGMDISDHNSSDASLSTGTPDGGMTSLLSMSLIDLQQFMDFDDCRRNVDDDPNAFYQNNVDWEGDGCRTAIVRLVLVIEAALLHGRCTYKMTDEKVIETNDSNDNTTSDHYGELTEEFMNDDSDTPVEVTLPEYESMNWIQIFMEMTGDINAFEQRVASENILMSDQITKQYSNCEPVEYQPSASELSTLRTLIAAWLENGQIYRIVALLVQANATILAPFYHKSAFLRSKVNATGFVRQLRSIDNVMILVDTIAVLSSPRLDETSLSTLFPPTPSSKPGIVTQGNVESNSVDDSTSPTSRSIAQIRSNSTTRYLDFHRNESLATSLRSERERRMQSWDHMMKEEMEGGLPVICRSRGSSKEDISLHKELHHIAMLFYYETVVLAIRDASRRTTIESDNHSAVSSLDADRVIPFSLLTMEAACPKRRLEIPDDDSSFLLRGQPRVINAVGVHRDPRNHDHSYKSFAATIEEVAKRDQYSGGRYLRRCLIRYYPSDRTAAVDVLDDARKLDQRKCFIPDTITLGRTTPLATSLLSDEFMSNRYLCQRWVPKGTTRSQSLLASGTMEGSDFTLVPRAGKAIEFVYRMSYYERPMVDLSGKHFTVFDSTALGVHRADASSLELSDASLSLSLEVIAADATALRGQRQHVELGKDGYPVVWLKSSRKQDDVHVEAKSYRLSFVRAALLITSARHEAQLKCVTSCIKAGSPSKATKALAESYLKPTLKLVEYAGSRSRKKQSVLMRDLKLGVNHIDIEQLRRNALLSPRYPTELLDLSAAVVDVVETPDVKSVEIFGVSNTMFKIKCTATITIVAPDDEIVEYENYRADIGTFAETYKEEWVVYRSLKDFQSLHKHLKLQVSAAESSGTAGSRLVGAATAAFAATSTSIARPRQRKVLIPSLSQASKAGALGVTKKVLFKRKETVEGYLNYILSPGHLLGRCSELLLFLGAAFPLDPNVRLNDTMYTPPYDSLGRTEMTRSILLLRYDPQPDSQQEGSQPTAEQVTTSAIDSDSVDALDDDNSEDDGHGDQIRKGDGRDEMKNIAVRSKVEKVRLQLVRTRIFELLRYQFGFENASFARNRLLGALKTASFAVTTPSEFQKTLYRLHIEYLNSEAVAGLINMLTNILWPNGTFFESSPPLSPEEIQKQAKTAKELLHKNFPDQVRAILGSELTRDGLDIFHEMLQNRLVVKSMAYMLFDHLWLEVFPEIGDVLTCGAAIDFDTKDI